MKIDPTRSNSSAGSNDDISHADAVARLKALRLPSTRKLQPSVPGFIHRFADERPILLQFSAFVAGVLIAWIMWEVYTRAQTGDLFTRCSPYFVNDIPIGQRCDPVFGTSGERISVDPEYRVAFLEHEGIGWMVKNPERLFTVPQRMAGPSPRLFYAYIPPEVNAGDPATRDQRVDNYFAIKYPGQAAVGPPQYWELHYFYDCRAPYRCGSWPWWEVWYAQQ